MKLIAGNSNLSLAEKVTAHLRTRGHDISLTARRLERFSDHEIYVVIEENVRGEHVFMLQSTSRPSNDNLMELLICMDALTRASAASITAVIPYFGYARQDRKAGGRTPITAKLVANLVSAAGADRVLTVDLHAGQIQGFFDIPTDNLFAEKIIAEDVRARYGDQRLVVVSPDVGGVVRARALARRLDDAPIAIVDKFRPRPGESQVMNVIGEVGDRFAVLIDDIVDSGGTICKAAEALIKRGANGVTAYTTHGVLSGDAVKKVMASPLQELVVSDSIEHADHVRACEKVREISIAPLIGEAIHCITSNKSISALFD